MKSNFFTSERQPDMELKIFDHGKKVVGVVRNYRSSHSKAVTQDAGGKPTPITACGANDIKTTKRERGQRGGRPLRGAVHLISTLHRVCTVGERFPDVADKVGGDIRIGINDERRIENRPHFAPTLEISYCSKLFFRVLATPHYVV
jgi:hypothetical protein